MIHLTINQKPVAVPEGTTILEAARSAGIEIPSLCYLKNVHRFGSCRICVVEVEGMRTLQASCMTRAREGMVVHTHSARVRARRKVCLLYTSKIEKINETTAQLTVAADETAPSINVVVWPKQAPGERVKTNVQIIRTYTVTYTDGQGGTLFADVVYRNLQLDATTPKYNDANVPVVAGWEFAGWSPAYAEKVTGNVTYVAQWRCV